MIGVRGGKDYERCCSSILELYKRDGAGSKRDDFHPAMALNLLLYNPRYLGREHEARKTTRSTKRL